MKEISLEIVSGVQRLEVEQNSGAPSPLNPKGPVCAHWRAAKGTKQTTQWGVGGGTHLYTRMRNTHDIELP